MKRRWRRLILIASTVLLTAFLVVLGLVIWLYQSGRLATLSQNLLQRLSGQNVTIEAIEFPAWNAVAFTHVRLQQRLSGGWQLRVESPRLEARYGLSGLLHQRVDDLRLYQPRIEVTRVATAALASPSPPPSGPSSLTALPLRRLRVQQGTLQVRWNHQTYTVHQLDATLRSQGERQLQGEVRGSLDGSNATLQAVVHITFGRRRPTARLQITARTVPVSRLAAAFSRLWSPARNITQGALDMDADLKLQDGRMQGNITATAAPVTVQAQKMILRRATFSTETAVEADFARQIWRFAGQAHLQAAHAGRAAEIVMTDVSLSIEANIEVNLAQQSLRSEGRVRLQAARAGRAPDITITAMSLSTEATMHASYARRSVRVEGQARVQAKRARPAPHTTMTRVSLRTPWQLSLTPAGWRFTATPRFQSHGAEIGSRLRLSRLSVDTKMPIRIDAGAGGLRLRGTPDFVIDTLQVHTGGQPDTILQVSDVRGRLPLQGNPGRIDLTDARVQTQSWRRQTPDAGEILKTFSLRGSGALDLRGQELVVREVTVALPQLGRMHASGVWHWPSRTAHDLQVRLAPTAVAMLQKRLQDWLPAAYRTWHVAGQTELQLRTARLSLRSPQRVQNLVIAWQLHDAAFTSPDSGVAGEHLNLDLQATTSFDTAAGQYTLQGTLTLQPFALLVGSLFPALEENRITSVVTFSGVYNSGAERLQVYVAGQLRHLGMLTVQGRIQRPIERPQVDLRLHLQALRAAHFWKTFLADTLRFPTLSQAEVQGTLDAALRLQGRPTNLKLHGTLDVSHGAFHTGTVDMRGVSLVLPVQMRYPLPKPAPQTTTLTSEAYGYLRIASLQIGSVEVGRLRLGLLLQSDTVRFQRDVIIPLWGGQIALQQITARHLLQPQRRIALRVRLRHLDLQYVPRGTSKLPLAGVINADFPQVQIRGERLETRGSLTIDMAGGVVRVFDIQARDLLSPLPTLRCSVRTEQPLSLLRLTQIYPIGDIGGTVRFSVTDLVVTAGEPAAFSLEFAVQKKGGERREITLRALNNLLFTTGSANVGSGLLGDEYRLPYKRFGAVVTLRYDTLRLRGKYHDNNGNEYFMQAPALGGGVSIVNRVPENGIPFRDFLQRLKATVLEKPSVQVK